MSDYDSIRKQGKDFLTEKQFDGLSNILRRALQGKGKKKRLEKSELRDAIREMMRERRSR